MLAANDQPQRSVPADPAEAIADIPWLAPAAPPAAEATDLARFVELLWQPGDVREVRILGKPGPGKPRVPRVASGYFDDPRRLVAAVAGWDGRANLYVTLNPVAPALLARYANRIEPNAKATTTDTDILERRFLLVDVDPKRPTGISSTAAETEAARDVARAVRSYLAGLEWPAPIVALTGNGYALLYAVRLANDAESTRLVVGVLAHLAERFDSDAVAIDTTVFNAARIGCLVGTVKAKGDATSDRPHRRSALVHVPATVEIVPAERLAELVPVAAPAALAASQPAGWVREWLDRAGVAYRERVRGTTTWYQLAECPFHPGEDLDGDCGVSEAADGKAGGKCLHNRGAGRTWHDFRDALGLAPPERIRIAPDRPSVDEREEPAGSDPRIWPRRASEKDPATALADHWLIEGVLRPGRLMILAAAEGVGKSQARLELAIRLATGHGALLDHYPIPVRSRVLLVDVENGDEEELRREEELLERLGLSRADLTDYWTLSLEGLSIGDQADQQYVREAIARVQPDVVIFDTGSSMVADEWGGELKAAVRFVRQLAREHGCAVVVAVHLVKPNRQAKRGKDAPAHGQELADVMGQWTRQADSVALMSEAGGRILWRMAKRVPASTLVLIPEGGAFHAIEVAAGEDIGADTRERVFACIATGQSDAASIAAYLVLSIRTVRRHVAALRRDGRVSADGPLAVSPAVTALGTRPLSTTTRAVSPAVTAPDVTTRGTEGDMSPAPIGEAGDSVTVSPATEPRPPCAQDPELFTAHASDRYMVAGRERCDRCESAVSA